MTLLSGFQTSTGTFGKEPPKLLYKREYTVLAAFKILMIIGVIIGVIIGMVIGMIIGVAEILQYQNRGPIVQKSGLATSNLSTDPQ